MAGNTAAGGANDQGKTQIGAITVNYSLIGTGITPTSGGNNVVNNNPQLAPLLPNGGPTRTHALRSGSPALDVGDPSIVFSPGGFDQRGTGFARVQNGRIDIGAFEAQPFTTPTADFDADGDIDGRDFLAWQRGFGTPNATRGEGNSDNDSDVDAVDLTQWQNTYGTVPLSAAITDGGDSAAAYQDAVDAAMAMGLLRIPVEEVDDSAGSNTGIGAEPITESAFAGDNLQTSAGKRQAADLRITNSRPSSVPAIDWLSDDLLEKVFS